MVQWTPQVEKLVREAGEAIDKHMTSFVNPEKGVTSTFLRALFNGKAVQKKLGRACEAAGIPFDGHWAEVDQQLVDLAVQNNSNAADKIKRWSAPSKDIAAQFEDHPRTFVNQIKYAKLKYGR